MKQEAAGLYAPRGGLMRELGAVREMMRLPLFWLRTRGALPRGHGRVVVLPGFATGDGSTIVLRTTLRSLGYDVSGWGLGRNGGDVDELLPRVTEVIAAAASDGPVSVLGWSLGGYLAREVARDIPASVRQVITLASPVIGGPKYTAAARFYRDQLGVDLDHIETRVAARNAVPLTVPVLALYSRSDNVVCPAACLDHHSPHVEHRRLDRCAHASFGFSPDVLRIVAERLANPP